MHLLIKNIFLRKTGGYIFGRCTENGIGGQSCLPYSLWWDFTQRFRKALTDNTGVAGSGKAGDVVQAYCFRIGPGPWWKAERQLRTAEVSVCGMTIESLNPMILTSFSLGRKRIRAGRFW